QSDQRAQCGVGIRGTRQRPQQINVRLVVVFIPTQVRKPRARRGLHQSEPTDARQLGSLRCGPRHVTTVAQWLRRSGPPGAQPPLRANRELQRQVSLQLEWSDVTAVIRSLRALVAQEEVKYVLSQRLRDQFGGFHGTQRIV